MAEPQPTTIAAAPQICGKRSGRRGLGRPARLTAARIGLARSGASLATGPMLELRLAHARARDAVHAPLDEERLRADLAAQGWPLLTISSAGGTGAIPMRPDLGRDGARCQRRAGGPSGQRPRCSTRHHRRPLGARGRAPRPAAPGRAIAAVAGRWLARRPAHAGAPGPGRHRGHGGAAVAGLRGRGPDRRAAGPLCSPTAWGPT